MTIERSKSFKGIVEDFVHHKGSIVSIGDINFDVEDSAYARDLEILIRRQLIILCQAIETKTIEEDTSK